MLRNNPRLTEFIINELVKRGVKVKLGRKRDFHSALVGSRRKSLEIHYPKTKGKD